MSTLSKALEAFLKACGAEGKDPLDLMQRRAHIRRIQPRKRLNQQALMDSVVSGLVEKALEEELKKQHTKFEKEKKDLKTIYQNDLNKEATKAHELGFKRGHEAALAEEEEALEQLLNDRLRNGTELYPWPVAIILAAEQHRILQTLADWINRHGSDFPFKEFHRELGIPCVPLYTDAPAPQLERCEDVPRGYPARTAQGIGLESAGYNKAWIVYLTHGIED